MDGQDHFVEPNHLHPAAFDFNCFIVCGFQTLDEVHLWWNSDEMFEIVKDRDAIEKMGIFEIQGLRPSIDVDDRSRFTIGDRFIMLELMKSEAFKPMQDYVDSYQRVTERFNYTKNLLFAEGVSGVLMNEYPLDSACSSGWRSKADARNWYDTDRYQRELMPLRKEYARCLTLLVPIFEDRIEDFERARKMLGAAEKLGGLLRAAKEH
eukprot:UN1394